MKIVPYFASGEEAHWREEIRKSDWTAGRYLYRLLTEGRFHARLGEAGELLLLTEGDRLIAFCTYTERDEIPDSTLTPWAGFVYTFPAYRGMRLMGKLLEEACRLAKADGRPFLYVSTDHVGLYEKYGFTYWKSMKDRWGNDCRIYRKKVREPYSIGETES